MKRAEVDAPGRRVPRLFTIASIGTAACATGLVACSVLLDWSGYTGGPGPDSGHTMVGMGDATVDADSDGDVPGDDAGTFADAPPLVSCGGGGLCSPPVPVIQGWSGPYSLTVGAPGSLPACDTKSYQSQPAFEGNYGIKADPAQCGCSCGPPQGQGCNGPKVTFFSDSACTSLCDAGLVNGCLVIPTCGSFLEIAGPTPSAGASCVPDAAVSVPPASWAGEARVCGLGAAATRGSCGSDKYCLPASTPYCILFAGDAGDSPCPPGNWYVHKHVFYGGMDDQRGCTSCTCGAPTGASCSFPQSPPAVPPVGSFDTTCTVYSGNPFFSPAPCTARVSPSDLAFKLLVDAGIEGGACQPSAVGPLDSGVVLTGATTLCCTQ